MPQGKKLNGWKLKHSLSGDKPDRKGLQKLFNGLEPKEKIKLITNLLHIAKKQPSKEKPANAD